MVFEITFENANGKVFCFGPSGGNWYGMSIGEGMEITLGKSQGFAQIGETVETQSVGGRAIDVTGKFFGDIVAGKNKLRNVCGPLAHGRLVFQKTHYVNVYVKAAPSFSAVKNNGLFKMQFFAPFPFFSALNERFFRIGGTVPNFRLPVNYATPHRFGTRASNKYVNVENPGDVKIPFKLIVRSEGISTNATVTNLESHAFLKINGILNAGEYVTIFRDANNALRAEKTAGSVVTDVITWVDDESSLFELEPGDNLISANDDEGGAAMVASFSFNPAVGALYES